MDMELNQTSLDTVCGALCYAMGIDAPEKAATPNEAFCAYVDSKLAGKKADRVIMFNPDAVAQWVYEKYPHLLEEAISRTELRLPLQSVMPSVTPVCFGTMYTGAQPAVHGIRRYEKPVIAIDTVFDALLRAGKKPVIIADTECSIGKIFQNRNMDYFLYKTIEEINAKAAEVILEDKYDFIVIYNGNYDARMHKVGTEDVHALGELRHNSRTFGMLCELVKSHWQNHRTLIGFAMDHGCHDIDGNCGSHGLDMPEDLNIVHLYNIF